MMTRALIGGRLFLPYQDDEGQDIPIASGEVVYKMSALSVDGQMVRVPATVIASIRNGVVEPKHLLYGVWTADIRPFSPTGYSKRIKFLADRPKMDLSEVIPIPIDGMEVVKGDDGTHIVSIEAQEDQGLIRIVVSDGEVFTFPLPRAALDEADLAVLNSALETVNAGTATVEELASTLQASVDSTSAELQNNLQALSDGVASVSHSLTEAERAAGEASTSAQNALGYAEDAYGHSQVAKGAQSGAEQALEDLRTGIEEGDFTGPAPTVEWSGTSLVVDGVPGPSLATTIPGPANTLAIGAVASGDTASATITGTAPSQTLNLTLPRGEQGIPGTATLSDTGKRRIDSSALAEGYVQIERTGPLVTISLTGTNYGVARLGSVGPDKRLLHSSGIPEGFRPQAHTPGILTHSNWQQVGLIVAFPATDAAVLDLKNIDTNAVTTDTKLRASVMFVTADPWPTTLPGTPIS